MTGKLYGIGLGPGAPDLLTLRAHRVLSRCRVVAYPALEDGESFARAIAEESMPKDAQEIRISIPMTVAREPAQAAYDTAARAISQALDDGQDVALLCEGDPLFYGSFMYLFARLKDSYEIEIIPGITSLTACAAAAGLPLAARNEDLLVLPAPISDAVLAAKIETASSIVLMKVGRHLTRVKALLQKMGLLEHAVFVERATLDVERVAPLSQVDHAAYFSMILITKGGDPWL